MVRKLKHHEQKLLRKTDFITYKSDNGHRDKAVMRRYMIQKPEDYHKYNRLCGVSHFYLGRIFIVLTIAVSAPTRSSPFPPPSRERNTPQARRASPQQALRYGCSFQRLEALRRREQRYR
jgi:hypothetical protein